MLYVFMADREGYFSTQDLHEMSSFKPYLQWRAIGLIQQEKEKENWSKCGESPYSHEWGDKCTRKHTKLLSMYPRTLDMYAMS